MRKYLLVLLSAVLPLGDAIGTLGCGIAPMAVVLDAQTDSASPPARLDAGLDDTGAPPDAAASAPLGCDRMDILFVIDNSASMADEQANLAKSFPRFVAVLDAFRAGNVDYRIGVTTTAFPQSVFIFESPGEEGTLLKTKDMERRWLDSSDPLLSTKFENLATVGTDGSSEEQPLKAVRAALVDRVIDGVNEGFLRHDALLAVVILTDEDDQSADGTGPLTGNPLPVTDFVEAIDRAKGGRAHWSAAVIAGGEAPYCTSRFGKAQYASKLLDFVDLAKTNVVFSSICSGDLADGLSDALEVFRYACDNYVI